MKTLLRSRSLVLVGMLLCARIAPAQAHTRGTDGENRYLYLLSGDAILEKMDTVTRHKVLTIRLAKHSSLIPEHGDQANSVVDGGSVYGAAYDAITKNVYTIVPSTGSEQGGIRHFHVLGFHIPDLRMVVSIDVPGDFEEGEPPLLSIDRKNVVVEAHGVFSRIEGKVLLPQDIAGSELPSSRRPRGGGSLHELDLAKYRHNEPMLPGSLATLAYRTLERSGDVVLIESPSIGVGLSFWVVNQSSMSITLLHLPFSSTAASIHLISSGAMVLVQEALYGKIPDLSSTTGRMALLQTRTSAVVRRWDEPQLAKAYVFTVTPRGDLAFYKTGHVGFLSIGVSSTSPPATALANRSGPWFFYAPQ